MEGQLVIRRAVADDAAALLEIYEPYITDTVITFEYEVPAAEEFAARITDTLTQFPYLVSARHTTGRSSFRFILRLRRRDTALVRRCTAASSICWKGRMYVFCTAASRCRTKKAAACTKSWALYSRACGMVRAGSLSSGTTWDGLKSVWAGTDRRSRSCRFPNSKKKKYRNVCAGIRQS